MLIQKGMMLKIKMQLLDPLDVKPAALACFNQAADE
jgi:hypothetical protein